MGSTSSHPALVSSPSREGCTPFNEYKERLPERCLKRFGYCSGHPFLSDSDPALAGSVSGRTVNRVENTIKNGSTRHYKPPLRFGMGRVPLGNEFAVVTDKDCLCNEKCAEPAEWNAQMYDLSAIV